MRTKFLDFSYPGIRLGGKYSEMTMVGRLTVRWASTPIKTTFWCVGWSVFPMGPMNRFYTNILLSIAEVVRNNLEG